MNNTEQHVEETIAEHEGLIKTPKQLIVTVILAFIVPIIVIMLLVKLVAASSQMGSGSDAQTAEAIDQRIKPVAGFSLVDANSPKLLQTGQPGFESPVPACNTSTSASAHKLRE